MSYVRLLAGVVPDIHRSAPAVEALLSNRERPRRGSVPVLAQGAEKCPPQHAPRSGTRGKLETGQARGAAFLCELHEAPG